MRQLDRAVLPVAIGMVILAGCSSHKDKYLDTVRDTGHSFHSVGGGADPTRHLSDARLLRLGNMACRSIAAGNSTERTLALFGTNDVLGFTVIGAAEHSGLCGM